MLNQCQFIGNMCADIEVRNMQSGGKVGNFTLAVNDKYNGQDRTEFVRVVIFNEKLIEIFEKYTGKGAKLFVSGKMQTRKWTDQSGNDKYSTEIVMGFDGKLELLSNRDSQGQSRSGSDSGTGRDTTGLQSDLSDDIPFNPCM